MTITEAMDQAYRELAPQRFLRTSAGYRACFEARVAELRAAKDLQISGSLKTPLEKAATNVGFEVLALPEPDTDLNERISG